MIFRSTRKTRVRRIKRRDFLTHLLSPLDIGGVWLENKYPGIACDIPAPSFQFLFENNPKWSNYYAAGEEIKEYVQYVADKYGARRYMKFKHQVVGAFWEEAEGKWLVKVKDMNSDQVSSEVPPKHGDRELYETNKDKGIRSQS